MIAKSPIRIMHVVHGMPVGGLENGVVNLINHLPQDEFVQSICCLDIRGEMIERIKVDIDIFELNRKRNDLKAIYNLAKVFKRWNPDIIHCRNWNTWPDTILANILTFRRTRTIWSFHGAPEENFLPTRRRITSKLLSFATYKLAAVCTDSANRYASNAGINQQRFDVLYNGVDCERFQPVQDKNELRRNLGLPLDTFILVCPASLTPIKDHQFLLNALAQAHQSSNILLLLIGEGSQLAQLTTQVKTLNLTDIVQFCGRKSNISDYLSAADAMVLPSRLEGMSNAILEAMATGLPVIAREVGGNPELIQHKVTGLLCHDHSESEMGELITLLMQNTKLRTDFGIKARAVALQEFSLSRMVQRYQIYYQNTANVK
ncbi:MAG: glycosyltransferase [Thiohalomonadales bacterium]